MSLIFDKVLELKEKFKNYYQHRKKLKALKNYSQVAPFMHHKKLTLIDGCLNEGFLTPSGEKFLDEILDNYKVKYLDWCYKSRWLKKTMHQMNKGGKKGVLVPVQTTIFDYNKVPHIPLAVLATEPKAQPVRRA